MMEKNTGGPAFPVWSEAGDHITDGMTLRDYFAAKAMHASLTTDTENAAEAEDHARWAYEMADAMLKAREQ